MVFQLKNCEGFKTFDWQRVQKVYAHLCEMIDRGGFREYQTYEPAYRATLYSIDRHGCIIENLDLSPAAPWRTWTGALLEHLIPWALPLRRRLESSGIRFVNFSYFRHDGDIKKHIDGKTDLEKTPGHCNLNHIVVAQDPRAMTWVGSDSDQQHYPTQTHSTWLLDTSLPHGVSNQGRREVFQLKFHSPFSQVRDLFMAQPDLFDLDSINPSRQDDQELDHIIDFLNNTEIWKHEIPRTKA